MSNLNDLPDSNRLWSSFWRPFISWWGNTTENGWLPHPFAFEGQKVSLRSWFSLFNFKANHRKLLVVDKEIQSGEHKGKQKNITIVTSANPHDGSSAHGNIALEVHDHIWRDVIQNENQIAISAGAGIPRITGENVIDETGPIRVTFLHEKGIKYKVREILANAKNGDSIDISMFYLSDRDIINDLLSADTRNVQIRLILDTNHDAFGHNKHGIPNTPVAKELVKRSARGIQIRWCKTNGEQCHAKLFMGKHATSSFLMVGSANFTRRNIDGFNLEANIYTEGDKDFSAWSDAHAYFEKLWTNNGGIFTTEYEAHEDTTFWKSSVARMMERTGLSSF